MLNYNANKRILHRPPKMVLLSFTVPHWQDDPFSTSFSVGREKNNNNNNKKITNQCNLNVHLRHDKLSSARSFIHGYYHMTFKCKIMHTWVLPHDFQVQGHSCDSQVTIIAHLGFLILCIALILLFFQLSKSSSHIRVSRNPIQHLCLVGLCEKSDYDERLSPRYEI